MATAVVSRNTVSPIEMAPGIHAWKHHDTPELSMVEVEFRPEALEPMHYHEKAKQLFMVLQGKVSFTVDGAKHELNAGQSIAVAPGVHHCAQNIGEGQLIIQVVSQPSASGDRVVL